MSDRAEAPDRSTTPEANSKTNNSPQSQSSEKEKVRNSFSNDERKVIRNYYYFSGHTVSQSEVRMWFQRKYNREVSQPVVSRILSDKYLHLDDGKEIPERFHTTKGKSSHNGTVVSFPEGEGGDPEDEDGNNDDSSNHNSGTGNSSNTNISPNETAEQKTDATSDKMSNATKPPKKIKQFPELESKILEWHVSGNEDGGTKTVDQYLPQAKKLWSTVYKDKPNPSRDLNRVWLRDFLKRNDIELWKSVPEAPDRKKAGPKKETQQEKQDMPKTTKASSKTLKPEISRPSSSSKPVSKKDNSLSKGELDSNSKASSKPKENPKASNLSSNSKSKHKSLSKTSASSPSPLNNSTNTKDDPNGTDHNDNGPSSSGLTPPKAQVKTKLHSSRFKPINSESKVHKQPSKQNSKRIISVKEAAQYLEGLMEFEQQHNNDPAVNFFYSQRLEALKDQLHQMNSAS